MSNEEVLDWLRERVERRAPAAVVRFSDAEAKLLAIGSEEGAMEKVTAFLKRETSIAYPVEDIERLKGGVERAFEEADVLAIGYSERMLEEHKAWLRRLASLHSQNLAEGRPPVPLAHCLFSHGSLEGLSELLTGRGVSAITCRDVKQPLERGWGCRDVIVYQLPSQYQVRDVDGPYEARLHGVPIWPVVHSQVRATLTVREPGEVFLVGAGVFGKDLCIEVREQGGIAIDIGSAFDQLAGKLTRGPVRRVLNFHAQGMPLDEVSAQLKRIFGVQPASEAIGKAIEEAVQEEIADWRTRALEDAYSSIELASLPVSIGSGAAGGRVCHMAVGVADGGRREPLGIWWSDEGEGEGEGDPWPWIREELHRRGISARAARSPEQPASQAAVAKAIENHGPFEDEQAANTMIYLALRRAEAKLQKPQPESFVDD